MAAAAARPGRTHPRCCRSSASCSCCAVGVGARPRRSCGSDRVARRAPSSPRGGQSGTFAAMGSATALVELGDRYWALGLPAAARSALARALAQTDDALPALRLTDLALAQGDAEGA